MNYLIDNDFPIFTISLPCKDYAFYKHLWVFVQSDCLRCVFTPLLISTYLDLNFLRDLIDSVVAVAENTADEHIRNQGQAVTLEEDPQLQLPFLLPEDRYSCEVIRGVPSGLKEFLSPLAGIGECLYEKIKFWSGEKLEFTFFDWPQRHCNLQFYD